MTEKTERSFVRWTLVTFLLVGMVAMLIVATAISYTLRETPKVIDTRLKKIQEDLNIHLILLRSDLNTQVSATREDLNNQLDVTRTDLMVRLDASAEALNARLNDTNYVLNTRLADLTATVGPATAGAISEVSMNVDRVTRDLHEVQVRLLEREPMIYSRILATSGEVMKTLDAGRLVANEIAKAAPEVAASAVTTSANVAEITHNITEYTKPKAWWKTLLPAGATALLKFIF